MLNSQRSVGDDRVELPPVEVTRDALVVTHRAQPAGFETLLRGGRECRAESSGVGCRGGAHVDRAPGGCLREQVEVMIVQARQHGATTRVDARGAAQTRERGADRADRVVVDHHVDDRAFDLRVGDQQCGHGR